MIEEKSYKSSIYHTQVFITIIVQLPLKYVDQTFQQVLRTILRIFRVALLIFHFEYLRVNLVQ